MKVNMIDSRITPNQTGFKGLQTSKIEVEDRTYYESAYDCDFGTYYRATIIKYYPFSDETDEEVKKFVKSNEYHKIIPPENNQSPDQTEIVDECKVIVKDKLPVTRKQYEDYVKAVNMAKIKYNDTLEQRRINAIKAFLPENAVKTERLLKDADLEDLLPKV